ncbi:MAG: IS66 family insertion sequence element accessory protein TnpB [Bryobacteraceae bacterium]
MPEKTAFCQTLCENSGLGDPLSGHVFVFSNAQQNRLKLLFWDGSGLWFLINSSPGAPCLAWSRFLGSTPKN